ncbi:hypothetical protein OG453_43215 [Streptomyces sp. NBC_01381]|uniref:imine reductase family protein n=1 Tax=Streptomyces sp. NBC_01381 TaxID=2903845 RepID=UPI00224F56B1|nr:hypothetical protein [Streptomyces sp. NBC_01381]MCX4673374.1 hypothetical protein [Streptomyces sp. NBC_01381]
MALRWSSAARGKSTVFSGSQDAFVTHREELASLGNAVHLGTDPALAPVYDTALFGLAWGALAGFYHSVALAGAAGVDPTVFAAVAKGHMPFVTSLMGEHRGAGPVPVSAEARGGRRPRDERHRECRGSDLQLAGSRLAC